MASAAAATSTSSSSPESVPADCWKKAIQFNVNTSTFTLKTTEHIDVYRYEPQIPECGMRPRVFQFAQNWRVVFDLSHVFVTGRKDLDLTGLIDEVDVPDFNKPGELAKQALHNTLGGMTADMAAVVAAVASSSPAAAASAVSSVTTSKPVDMLDDKKLKKKALKGTIRCFVFRLGDIEYWVTPSVPSNQILRDLATWVLDVIDSAAVAPPAFSSAVAAPPPALKSDDTIHTSKPQETTTTTLEQKYQDQPSTKRVRVEQNGDDA